MNKPPPSRLPQKQKRLFEEHLGRLIERCGRALFVCSSGEDGAISSMNVFFKVHFTSPFPGNFVPSGLASTSARECWEGEEVLLPPLSTGVPCAGGDHAGERVWSDSSSRSSSGGGAGRCGWGSRRGTPSTNCSTAVIGEEPDSCGIGNGGMEAKSPSGDIYGDFFENLQFF